MSEPTDPYARRLERTVAQAQAIVAGAIEPEGIPYSEAIAALVELLDDPDLTRIMIEHGARERHPDAISTEV